MIPLDLPDVTRVRTERGDHVEPPLKETWSQAAKLAWHAAVVAHDTGLRITLHDQAWTDSQGRPRPGNYSITVYGTRISSVSALTYRDAWSYLNGVDIGARAKETR